MKAEALKWDVNRDVELKQNYLNNMLKNNLKFLLL